MKHLSACSHSPSVECSIYFNTPNYSTFPHTYLF
nr:MAG TPA: hypothetical protein [Caudoviricetes sp.]